MHASAGLGNAQTGGPFQEFRQNVNIAIFIAQMWSRPVEAWLIKAGTAGELHFAWPAAVGMLFMPVFGILACNSRNEPALQLLLLFWAATFVALLVNRIRHFQLRRTGYWPHSLYSGRPWLPGNEVTVKQFGMPTVTGLAAYAASSAAPVLGAYLAGAAVSMFITCRISVMAEEAELRNLRDALTSQQVLASRMRERRWR